MIEIRHNTDLNFTDIRAIANEVWPIAYGEILSQEQLDYMMQMMYSVSTLQNQAEKGHHFILAMAGESAVGFAGYEFDYNGTSKTKIHKIYILSNQQGKGTGRLIINYITEHAGRNNQSAVILNVNKNNTAQIFYRTLGFEITDDVVVDIGSGYVMDDYIMEKTI